jgi:hypothetical protein
MIFATYSVAIGFAIFFVIMTVVVTIGGIADLRYLFKSLNEQILDETDDGRVVRPAGSEKEVPDPDDG